MKHILAVLVFTLSIGIAYAAHLNITLDDLFLLAESRVSDKTILAFIEPREITFTLGTEEIEKLRKAGLSEEVIQYLLSKCRQAGLTYNQYIKPPVPYSYPGYYYGPSLYLGFGRGHHHVGRHHAHHAATHHVGPHRSRSHSVIAGSHHTSTSSALSSRHHSNRSHSIHGRSRHSTSGSSALSSRHHSNRNHSIHGRSSHNTSSSRVHSTNRRSSHSSSHSGSHGGRSHGGKSHGGRSHGGSHGRGHSGH